jgi:hypothetical protein
MWRRLRFYVSLGANGYHTAGEEVDLADAHTNMLATRKIIEHMVKQNIKKWGFYRTIRLMGMMLTILYEAKT